MDRSRRVALLNNVVLAPPRVIREMIGGAPLSSRWYAPTWSVSGGVLSNTPTLGAELLLDPGFENWLSATNLTNYSEYLGGGTTTINRESAVIRSGVYAARCDVDASNNKASIYQASGGSVGDYALFTVYAKESLASKTMAFEYGGTASPGITVPTADFSVIVATLRATVNTNAAFVSGSAASSSIYFDDASVKTITRSTLFASVGKLLANVNLVAPPISTLQTATQAGIILRLDSPTNPQSFVIAYCDGAGNVKIEKCVSGTYTTLSTVSAAYGATKYFSAKMNGSSISIYYGTTDFGTLIATVTVSDATVVNNTRHGLFSTYSGNQFAGTFSVVPYA